MAGDRLQYSQGKQHATSILLNLGIMLNSKEAVSDALRNLEKSCGNWPESYSQGVMSVVTAARGINASH